jgi:hypothetical protein
MMPSVADPAVEIPKSAKREFGRGPAIILAGHLAVRRLDSDKESALEKQNADRDDRRWRFGKID